MSYCLNPYCQTPQNPSGTKFCLTCGTKLLLKDRYRAIKPIGQGGFGRTFLAVDEDKPSKPRCAIKQFFPQAHGTSTAQKAAELFSQEAVQLDNLGKHPQIPELLAHFSQDDRQYLVQEFIDGQNLAQTLVDNGAFNETQILALLNDLLPVLQFVCDRQVIHRDIKPENIIYRSRDARFVIVDFGASKFATGTALINPGTSIGSPEYVAPEQARGRATFASDIYSLGATCIHLLTQLSPFDLYDINEDAWVWRQYLSNPVSDLLAKVLDKMLENAVCRRYQSADEVIKDLNTQTYQVAVAPLQKLETPSTPVKSIPNSVVVKPSVHQYKSQVDDELAELRSHFLGNTSNEKEEMRSPKTQSPNPNKSQNLVDLELEDVKSQFL